MSKLLVHVGDGDRRVIESDSIYYVEAADGDTIVHRRSRSLRDVRELGKLERAWRRHSFVRVHKDYLVHPDRILRIHKRANGREWEVRLAPPVNRVLPVGRRRLRALWAAFED